MNWNFIIILLLLISGMIAYGANGKQNFDRSSFYAALASEDLDVVNAELALVLKSSFSIKDAFEGALLMKKAGLVFFPGSKFNLFKSGHKKLDNAIAKESKNAELRFLRLMIQEHAPRILNYRQQIDEDSQLIGSAYKSLLPVVQKEVTNYSKNSKALQQASFN